MTSPDLSGWLLTYLIHSTLLLGAAWLIAPRFRSHRIREMLWKTALFGGFVTATGQSLLRVSPLAGRMTVAAPRVVAAQPRRAPASPRQKAGDFKPASRQSVAGTIEFPAAPVPSRFAGISQEQMLVLSWAIGAAFLLSLDLARRLRFSRRIAARRGVTEGPVAAITPMIGKIDEMIGYAAWFQNLEYMTTYRVYIVHVFKHGKRRQQAYTFILNSTVDYIDELEFDLAFK